MTTEEVRRLVLDLWKYVSGKSWEEIDEDDCDSEGEWLGSLHQRVKKFLEEGKEE